MSIFSKIKRYWNEETKVDFEWSIYYRNKPTGSILSDFETPFKRINVSKGFWCADPLIFRDGDNTFLFFELFDKKKDKGSIACLSIKEILSNEYFIVMEEPFHLSFPFVFRDGENYYMIPETGSANNVGIYKAEVFPNKWIKERDILTNVLACDSILYHSSNKTYLLSSFLRDNAIYASNKLFELNNDFEISCEVSESAYSNEGIRNGGPLFEFENHFYRPGQYGVRGDYGKALYIWEFDLKTGKDIKISSKIETEQYVFEDDTPKQGIHTYSSCEEYEFIDVKRIIKNNFFKRVALLVKRIFKRRKKLITANKVFQKIFKL